MDALEERLRFIFSNVNEWLKFGEAKNGALLAINVSSMFAVMEKTVDAGCLVQMSVTIFVAMNFFSALLAMLSYMPILNMPILKTPKAISSFLRIGSNKNALYFGDLSQMTSEDLLKNIDNEKNKASDFCNMVADQIICNSKIATKKYEFFTIALWFTILSYITAIFLIIISLFWN